MTDRTGPSRKIAELKAENDRLRDELRQRDNMVMIRSLGVTADWSPEEYIERMTKAGGRLVTE
ncbi:hypothetical protein [Paracoccus tegillarcae]|nr:hypothetical protein [Paracoccus tegillarcae]